MLRHTLHERIQRSLMGHRALELLVIGAGGNGSKLMLGLSHLHHALTALGYPGLHVTLADGETISPSNIVRQAYYPADVGCNKAITLVNRINLACGTRWRAEPKHFGAADIMHHPAQIVISCVDTRAARAEIHHGATQGGVVYWLDLGNSDHTGQLVLGCPLNHWNRRTRERLRTAAELFPELIDTHLPDDDTPSCSTLEALEQQDLFINDLLVTQALNLLWQLLKHWRVTHHGAFISASSGGVSPIPVDSRVWRHLAGQSCWVSKTD